MFLSRTSSRAFFIDLCAHQVDDGYNITGLLDFPGTIVPLPSICVYSIMFDIVNRVTPFTDRNLWPQTIFSIYFGRTASSGQCVERLRGEKNDDGNCQG